MSTVILGEGSFAIVRFAVAAVFALAAGSKLWSFRKFATTIAHYPHASSRSREIATLLIAGELAAAAALPFRMTAPVGGALAIALLGLFSVVLWWYGIPHEGDCGCLGALPSARTSNDVIIRNVALVLAAGYGVLGPVAWPSAPPAVGIVLLIAAAILVLRPVLRIESNSTQASRRSALYKVAAVGGALALLPLLRYKEAFGCTCGQILSCGSCNHYIQSYYSGCCTDCPCSPRTARYRRQWYQTCSVCCYGNVENYCYTTYVCLPC